MQPPSARRPLRWIDQRWDEISEIFPSFIMDWLYDEHGAARLEHHRWMLTRPSFQAITRELHHAVGTSSKIIISSVTSGTKFNFPDGTQRTLALRFFHRLQDTDGAEVSDFLAATACELLGVTPFCTYQETELQRWIPDAIEEEVPTYGNVYNMMTNIVAQTMLWTLGCLPYTALQQRIMSSNVLAFRTEPDENLLLLKRYTLTINDNLRRISKHG